MNRYLIYGLADPRTDELRYIGRSSCGLTRPTRHWTKYVLEHYKTHSGNWIRSLRADGLLPEIVVIEEAPLDLVNVGDIDAWLNESEKFWISYWRYIGARLTNLTDGGEGITGHRMSEDQKQKLSALKTGKKLTGHALEATRRANAKLKGIKRPNNRPMSPETRLVFVEKRRVYMIGKKLSDEHKKAIGSGNKGKIRTEEVKQRISATKRVQNALKREGMNE